MDWKNVDERLATIAKDYEHEADYVVACIDMDDTWPLERCMEVEAYYINLAYKAEYENEANALAHMRMAEWNKTTIDRQDAYVHALKQNIRDINKPEFLDDAEDDRMREHIQEYVGTYGYGHMYKERVNDIVASTKPSERIDALKYERIDIAELMEESMQDMAAERVYNSGTKLPEKCWQRCMVDDNDLDMMSCYIDRITVEIKEFEEQLDDIEYLKNINLSNIDPEDFDEHEDFYFEVAMERDAYYRRQEAQARAEEKEKKENKPDVYPTPYARPTQMSLTELKEQLATGRRY